MVYAGSEARLPTFLDLFQNLISQTSSSPPPPSPPSYSSYSSYSSFTPPKKKRQKNTNHLRTFLSPAPGPRPPVLHFRRAPRGTRRRRRPRLAEPLQPGRAHRGLPIPGATQGEATTTKAAWEKVVRWSYNGFIVDEYMD